MQLLLLIILPLAGGILGWTIRWLYARFQLSSTEQRAERLQKDAVKDAEARKKELILETRDALQRERNEQEKEG
jgi:ribonuclease Y